MENPMSWKILHFGSKNLYKLYINGVRYPNTAQPEFLQIYILI
jgi:hypothetical protein